MLNLFSRVIKNLIDMSFEQENIINIIATLKSKKDSGIYDLTKKENVIMQQYKSVFVQISDLSKKVSTLHQKHLKLLVKYLII